MDENGFLTRVCFNFLSKCNLTCPFCYCPFNGSSIDLGRCKAVVKKVKELGATIVTFAGGDPFAFVGFPNLLEYSKSLGLELQVDTNGIQLNRGHRDILKATVKILGLPIDGATANTHAQMRLSQRHFGQVMAALDATNGLGLTRKINTVVTAKNCLELLQMQKIVEKSEIDIWSLYQFWRFDNITKDEGSYILSDQEFMNVVSVITRQATHFRTEVSPVSERKGTYFFVSHEGTAYCNEAANPHEYAFLGSVFDENIMEKWRETCTCSIREKAYLRHIINVRQSGNSTCH